MILGRGTAQTDKAIIAEYHQFRRQYPSISAEIQRRLHNVPWVMQRRIGKPVSQWTDDDILGLFINRAKASHYPYSAFLAFLFFHGYRRATIRLLTSLPLDLCRHFRQALVPHRQRLEQARRTLCYASNEVGAELNLLILLLAVVFKPLEELTRSDFDAFQAEYQVWFREAKRREGGHRQNPRLSRLERYLIHWNIIPPRKRILRHEEYFSRLRHEPIRIAILSYMQWCKVKYKRSTVRSHRSALLKFFLWFQEQYSDRASLDDVNRAIALAYARRLKRQVEENRYSLHYVSDLQRSLRLFYDFAIDERLETSPDRNPFTIRDLPRRANPVPRYLSDHEMRAILGYCENDASLKEKTIVITLLHTGIRAGELAALKVSNIVQIQETWKLHIQEGKGLKDRLIPLTPQCLEILQTWQQERWEQISDHLFTYHGRPWSTKCAVSRIVRKLGKKLGIEGLSPHRFRHTFAVALLNYGIRESALQKLMGHTTLNMTLEYARILDKTVEQAFNTAVEQMQLGPVSWVPSFFNQEDYALLTHGEEAINWIRLPHGYCRRHAKLYCESDVKCLLCDRYCTTSADLPQLREMHERFLHLGMPAKANIVSAQIVRFKDVTVSKKDAGLDDTLLQRSPQHEKTSRVENTPPASSFGVAAL